MKGTASAALLLGIGMAIAPARADAPGELVEEIWETAQVEGARIGFVHTSIRKRHVEGVERLRAVAELDLTLRRHNTLLHVRREQGTEETPEGKVLGVFMRQSQDGGGRLELIGVVEDGRLHVRVDNGRIERRIRWNEEVVGLYRLEHLFQARKPKPGDRFTLLRYEPTYNTVLTVRVTVKEREEVVLGRVLETTPPAKCLRVEMTADKLEAPGASVQPPPVVWWLDDHFVPVRRQIELDGLGTVVLTRTSREAATAPATPGRVGDIGLKTLIPLNRSLARPYATRSAVYRITLRGDPDPGSALARDTHQEVRNLKDDTFELYVHPVRKPERRGEAEAAPAEFLQPCHFINCDDSRVKELARRAAGDEKDPWRKARRLERWVKQSMRPDNAVPLGPAGDVARQLRGDCRQYALLTAALCRAEGIPARTAVGLLYVEKGKRPLMGFHMWTEVWIDGQWLGLDGTLGQGGVSAAHVKIADHSWHDTHSLTPLLPANRVLGKIGITILSAETGE
jgi:transglutaminase-like putative cysteine protease